MLIVVLMIDCTLFIIKVKDNKVEWLLLLLMLMNKWMNECEYLLIDMYCIVFSYSY